VPHDRPPVAGSLADVVDGLFARFRSPGAPGASVAIFHQGRPLLVRSYGLASLEPEVPATPSTQYRLASLTKQFTATAVLLLIADDVLREDTPLSAVLPELADPPGTAEPVRIRHLLTHTSGLPDFEALLPAGQTEPVRDVDVLRLLAESGERYFAPGTGWRYSNTAYALLALVVERLSGRSFPEFLRERIFRPLGMERAVAYVPGGPEVVERAYGYSAEGVGFRFSDQSITSATLGDGGVYASVAELALWEAALVEGRLLPPALLEAAWTPARLVDGTAIPYGYGWYVDEDRGRTRLTHHGETIGFTNAVIRYPHEGVSVWVLTNRTASAPWDLAQSLADEVLARVAGGGAGEAARWPFHITG
jgi:CubicO group peptidase (beta-lactamase class C family)